MPDVGKLRAYVQLAVLCLLTAAFVFLAVVTLLAVVTMIQQGICTPSSAGGD